MSQVSSVACRSSVAGRVFSIRIALSSHLRFFPPSSKQHLQRDVLELLDLSRSFSAGLLLDTEIVSLKSALDRYVCIG